MLEVTVIDDGPGLRDGNALIEGRGVGLRNTRERLAVLYSDKHRFAVLNSHPGMRIEIGLPLEKVTVGAVSSTPKPTTAGTRVA
jgi:signal transduction histidine kinase